jgi:hypothetical protein
MAHFRNLPGDSDFQPPSLVYRRINNYNDSLKRPQCIIYDIIYRLDKDSFSEHGGWTAKLPPHIRQIGAICLTVDCKGKAFPQGLRKKNSGGARGRRLVGKTGENGSC